MGAGPFDEMGKTKNLPEPFDVLGWSSQSSTSKESSWSAIVSLIQRSTIKRPLLPFINERVLKI
jgi:hypothetical protein